MARPTRTAARALTAAVLLAGGATSAAGAAEPTAVPFSQVQSSAGARGHHFDKSFHLRPSDPPRMQRAWRTWRAEHDHGYETRVRRSCFCVRREPVVSVIRHGDVVHVARADDPRREIHRLGFSVDRLFFLLRRAYAQADSVDVRYGPTGVPVSIGIDYDDMTIDDEMSYGVRLS